ncbi:DUF4386 domain-containing protein [Celeribacter arenosi]|uniref:DUF4386 domain-containing protein n=1 Tax=Celeribacter arenosi TaxID=792649 RepID=A0ABP7KC85_9RHOB
MIALSMSPAQTPRNFFAPNWALIAGLAYFLLALFGIFAELFVRMPTTVVGDPTATAQAIRDNIGTVRWAVVADTGMILADVALTVAFFALFWRTRPGLTAILIVLQIARIPMMGANLTNHVAAILLASGQEALQGFSPEMIDSLAYFSLRLHHFSYVVNGINFGAWCLVLGWILLSTGYAPKLFAILLLIDGPIAFFDTIGQLVFPEVMTHAWAEVVSSLAIGEPAFILFLLFAPGYLRRRIELDVNGQHAG